PPVAGSPLKRDHITTGRRRPAPRCFRQPRRYAGDFEAAASVDHPLPARVPHQAAPGWARRLPGRDRRAQGRWVNPPPGDSDDRELMRLHVAGDPDAFGELVRRHRDRLWAVALRTIGEPEEAADALQDALLSAFRRADSYRGEAAVTTWLHRVVVNACMDRYRRHKIRQTQPLPTAED